jgi:Transcriptional regulatory protein, C terminal
MPFNRILRSGKRQYLFGSVLLLFIAVVCVAFSMAGSNDFDTARREVLLRRIGHELLLQSGDDTSRVLPVKKVNKNKYEISFEKAFSFQPDSLVNITQRLLAKDPHANDYVVNVVNSANASVTYGYAISKNKKDDIVACIGRKQPMAAYTINITFKPASITTVTNKYLVGGLLILIVIAFIVFRNGKPNSSIPVSQPAGMYTLGATLFNAEKQQLLINGATIDLTKTETRLLHIFAMLPNEAIERSRLQKEIWEDEGVIVGRSLDMFISKLRKKLEHDPNLKIVVLRGKGYKLQISS